MVYRMQWEKRLELLWAGQFIRFRRSLPEILQEPAIVSPIRTGNVQGVELGQHGFSAASCNGQSIAYADENHGLSPIEQVARRGID